MLSPPHDQKPFLDDFNPQHEYQGLNMQSLSINPADHAQTINAGTSFSSQHPHQQPHFSFLSSSSSLSSTQAPLKNEYEPQDPHMFSPSSYDQATPTPFSFTAPAPQLDPSLPFPDLSLPDVTESELDIMVPVNTSQVNVPMSLIFDTLDQTNLNNVDQSNLDEQTESTLTFDY
jgi:hypothetical protein